MIPKNRTLEGKNWTLGGEGGSKIVENRRTSFMYVPLVRSLQKAVVCSFGAKVYFDVCLKVHLECFCIIMKCNNCHGHSSA